MLYPGDDFSYFAYATSFAFGDFPSTKKEYVEEASVPPLSRVGIGLISAPLTFAFSLIDRVQGSDIVQQRTKENITKSWAVFGAILTAVIALWFTCVLLYKTLLPDFGDKISSYSVILMTLCQGAGLYAFRRPVFSHVYELLIHSTFLYLFVSRQRNVLRYKKGTTLLFIGVLSAMLTLVRQNGVIYSIIWPISFFCFSGWKWNLNRNAILNLTKCFAIAAIVYYPIKYIPYILNKDAFTEINKTFETSAFMFNFESPWFYLKRIYLVIFGIDWGLLFTAPFLIIGVVAFFFKKLPHRLIWILLSLPLLINFYLLMIWKTQGSWYGYRYLVFNAIPILIFPFAWLIKSLSKNIIVTYSIMFLAFSSTLSMWVFEGSPNTQLFGVTTEFANFVAPGNLSYQIESWKLLLNPAQLLQTLFKGGPAYVFYVLMNIVGMGAKLPEKFIQLYPFFDLSLMIKTLILYSMPFLLIMKRR